ncbi:class I SAM-dependent methyltransferase [Lutibacter sp. HS1-25]|uniref:class I SAM-dependent methyltransferase n=1 Tax=Lutibacter sp. HS1-25 TaxID=2485000 RepID=UPI0010125DC3|nr:class I SAM-dependent methyltransferase [Lutibacter sp. HS1-25]RXP64419.1 class I SAM-dependent methyltransferase [Lutibacter sp. HS1-25]
MNSKNELYLTCEDYTVSNKKFDLLYNPALEMLETYPQPKGVELASYYESSDYISHTDSKETIVDKLYQFVKSIALKNKLSLLNSFKTSEKNILDIGCGTGDFLQTCKNNSWNVVGVEPNKNARNLAETKLSTKIYEDLDQLSNQQFDCISMWHVLEHVPDLDLYISKLKSLLKQNGVLIVAVPNYKSYDAQYYKQFWAAYDVPRHLWHFSKKSIELLFSKNKMSVVKILPMKFDSFYVSLLSEKYKTGNTNFLKAFYVGFVSNLKAMNSKQYSSLIYVLKND